MRVIKFRGMATQDYETSTDGLEKGDWVEGYYYFSFEHNCPMIMTRLGAECAGVGSGLVDVDIPIDIKTLGQLTDRKDKDGKKIFEGDILETNKRKLRKELFQVEWSDMNSGWRAFHIDEFIEMEAYMFKNSKVVGSIHKNPELIK